MSETGSMGDDAILAAEYALGLVEGRERAEADRLMLAEPSFAREVEGWRTQFAALAESVAAEPRPPDLWSRIQRRLDGEGGGAGAPGEVVLLHLKRSLTVWRSASAAAAALAAVLAVALVWPRPAVAPIMTAQLASAPGRPAVFVALYDPTRKALVLTPAAVSATPNRSPELWLIPVGGKPVPLGVAAFERAMQMAAPAASGLSGGTLAVSIEPRGGSPTGQPTGPVVATGQLVSL